MLLPVNWSLWHQSRQSNYLPQWSLCIAYSLWPKWIRTVECGILVIKKSVKTLLIELHSVFLNVPIKQKKRKKKRKKKKKTRDLIVKEKEHSFVSASVHLQHWNTKMSISMSTFFLELISILGNSIYFLFLLFVNTHHDHKLIIVKH